MSQYIKLDDRLGEWRQAHRQVLSGTLSKISIYRSSTSLSKGDNPNYIKQKVSLRIKKEESNAYSTHEQSLCQNYVKLKHNLQIYARSKSMKLEKAFEKPFIASKQPPKADHGRLSSKSNKEDRVIFIDRKYNREMAIQKAIVTEIQGISKEKIRMKKMMSEKYFSPLMHQTKLLCLNAAEHEESRENSGNPVLVSSHTKPLKKKKKAYKIEFMGSKDRK